MAKWDAWSEEPLHNRINELEDQNDRYREALEWIRAKALNPMHSVDELLRRLDRIHGAADEALDSERDDG